MQVEPQFPSSSSPQVDAAPPEGFAPPAGFVAFLDPEALIERSRPMGGIAWPWYAMGTFLMVVMVGTWAGGSAAPIQAAVRGVGTVLLAIGTTALAAYTWRLAQRRNDELKRVEAIEEWVQLRRWTDAAGALQQLLSRPMVMAHARVQSLVYLAAVLARYQRYADAITVHEYVLEHVPVDAQTVHSLRLGRAMAMLHEDRLVDANRAIVELRRGEGARESAGLALVEIYRDVKTGHPAEAIETFRQRLPQLRPQLGHRLADAWALVARAYDMVGQLELAAEAYANATVLAPIGEVSRRYAEVAALTGRYRPVEAPGE